jgi:hypothetical protein
MIFLKIFNNVQVKLRWSSFRPRFRKGGHPIFRVLQEPRMYFNIAPLEGLTPLGTFSRCISQQYKSPLAETFKILSLPFRLLARGGGLLPPGLAPGTQDLIVPNLLGSTTKSEIFTNIIMKGVHKDVQSLRLQEIGERRMFRWSGK